jgi:hypothetical protein
MNDIHTIPGSAPKSAQSAKNMPFEIIIRTTDQEYLDNGAPPECSEKAVGYFCVMFNDDESAAHSQGSISLMNIVAHMLNVWDERKIALALGVAAGMRARNGKEGEGA